MDNNAPQVETPEKQPEVAKPCCDKKSKALLYVGLVFAFILILALVAYTAYMYGKEAEDEEIPANEANKEVTTTETTETNVTTTTTPSEDTYKDWKTFSGEYFTMKHPQDWRVEEITDSEFYSGPLGFKVYNSSDKTIFNFEYITGIGGYYDCDTAFTQFSDGDPNVFDERYGDLNCDPEPEVITLTDDYVKIEVLDTNVRRIEKEYYIDSANDDEYFDISEYDLFSFESKIENKDSGTFNTDNHYAFTIQESIETESLDELDKVLESVTEIN